MLLHVSFSLSCSFFLLIAVCASGQVVTTSGPVKSTVAVACATDGSAEDACAAEEVNLLQQITRHTAVDKGDKIESQQGRQTLAAPLVDEVWTYGAPATHDDPFWNFATADGCFPGLRCYTENILHSVTHQVDAAAMNNWKAHARTNSVVLRQPGIDSIYTPCKKSWGNKMEESGHPDWPQRGASVFEHWPIHQQPYYEERLDKIEINGYNVSTAEPFKTARKYALFAWKSYDTPANTMKELSQKTPDWTLVSREVHKISGGENPVMVVQQDHTLDCALVFTGTNSMADLPASTTQYSTGYCGFSGVHVGYRNKLEEITKDLWPKVRPTLERCNKVFCVGHSLAGSLCELFSACVNSGHTTDPDFRVLAWDKARNPTRMPSLAA